MTRDQFISSAEKILRTRRAALLRLVHNEIDQLRMSDAFEVRDQIDEAIDDEFQSVSSGLAEIESRELERIEHALKRLQEGKYGICEECNRRIPVARLRLIPWATKCVRCQDRSSVRNELAKYAQRWEDISDDGDDEETQLFEFSVAEIW